MGALWDVVVMKLDAWAKAAMDVEVMKRKHEASGNLVAYFLPHQEA
jgi:hypothetical protein